MSSLTRAFIDGMLPPGSAFRVQPKGDLDDLLFAMADNMDTPISWATILQNAYDPLTTIALDDLERERGVVPNKYLTEAQRRTNLASRMYTKAGSRISDIQAALDATGFGAGGYGLTVYDNNGGANPANFAAGTQSPNITLGGPGQYLGNTVYMGYGQGGGQLIVNGGLGTVAPLYWGLGNYQLGQTAAVLGYYTNLQWTPASYPIPSDSGYWPMFFFLGANATYTSGVLTGLAFVNVPSARQNELIEIICRLKPIGTWAVAYVNWT